MTDELDVELATKTMENALQIGYLEDQVSEKFANPTYSISISQVFLLSAGFLGLNFVVEPGHLSQPSHIQHILNPLTLSTLITDSRPTTGYYQ